MNEASIMTKIDEMILRFEQWFKVPSRGATPLTGFEKEILRSFLYWRWQIDEVPDQDALKGGLREVDGVGPEAPGGKKS